MNGIYQKGAIASGHTLTTKAGLGVMADGGNAVDGAIASALMACVCEPVLASPGGGGFAMIKSPYDVDLYDFFAQTPRHKKTENIDFTEIEADFGTAKQIFHIGNASSATPGFFPGLFVLHEKHALLPMATLAAPAIKAARDGVTVSPFQHYLSTVVAPILLATEQSRQLFAPQGHLLKAGQTFKNPQLADFLEDIANNGPDAFPVTQILASQSNGGHLTDKDFNQYQVFLHDSLKVEISDATVHLNPPPSSGGSLIAVALRDLSKQAGVDPLHLAIAMLTTDIARQTFGSDIKTMLDRLGPPSWRGTTHISVIDAKNNACSLTLSNGEGNGEMVASCGFMMNNMLGEADINPGGALGWPVNQRMSSMMCPTIIEHANGSTWALGSGGSNRIRSTIFQVLVNLLLKEQSISKAITAPRMHVENNHLDYEDFDDLEIHQKLQSAFPDYRRWDGNNMFFGGCHIAGKTADQHFDGAGDQRRHGAYEAI
jgi:gamma-glutamyltranspeptidase/glutathione hydrolase